LTPG